GDLAQRDAAVPLGREQLAGRIQDLLAQRVRAVRAAAGGGRGHGAHADPEEPSGGARSRYTVYISRARRRPSRGKKAPAAETRCRRDIKSPAPWRDAARGEERELREIVGVVTP